MSNNPDPALLLDTNIFVELLRGNDKVREFLLNKAVYVSVISLGELYYGAMYSAKPEENIQKIRQIQAQYPVLRCDETTAYTYASIFLQLRRSGNPIQMNDVWIAALAQQHQCALVSQDNDFKAVANLTVISWIDNR